MYQLLKTLGIAGLIACSASFASADEVKKVLAEKRKAFPEGNLFSVLDSKGLDAPERKAMEFLYAYMPTNDLVDIPGAMHLENTRLALRARRELPWGATVPAREWQHFVLPARVNNERLDSARIVLYEELRDRVRHLSMYDAVLEVNHWCHERVTYAPSDSRTSSPLATIRSAYGRCGEESTLLVAALRTVGIPARQVYTPRWAHTDDNHAWVEAWVDGKWYFLGACEPEPVLNLGWFNAPASRAMLMHTRVYGAYDGPEEQLNRTAYYTEINVIDNYASSAVAEVKVLDTAGGLVPEARVEFCLYNYGEFYPVVRKQTNRHGLASLRAGRGDMVVFASAGEGDRYRFGVGKLSFGKDAGITIVLDKKRGQEFDMTFDLVPPAEAAKLPLVTEAQRAACNVRLAYEDSVRNAYVADFQAHQLEGLDARGNWLTLRTFLSEAKDKDLARGLLQAISAKDRRDITLEVLNDHLYNTPTPQGELAQLEDVKLSYIYSPRVSNEHLTPYKGFFAKHIDDKLRAQLSSPEAIAHWCTEHIQIDDKYNPMQYPISPEGVWRSRRADRRSLGLFYVALCRSLGWAAREDAITGEIQYYDLGRHEWSRASFASSATTDAGNKGTLRLTYEPTAITDNPKYYTHFSLSNMDGERTLLSYDEGDNGMEIGSSWAGKFKEGTPLKEGYYLLVSGSRMASGSVLAHLSAFAVRGTGETVRPIVMREDTTQVAVIGSFDAEMRFAHIGGREALLANAAPTSQSVLATTGRGYYVLGVIAAQQEPTNHALKDISALSKAFEEWGRPLVLLFADESQRSRFQAGEFAALPSSVTFGIDNGGAIAEAIKRNLKLGTDNLPIFIVADTFNRVVFVSQGYTIGLGEQIKRIIRGVSAPTPEGGCSLQN